MSNYSLMFKFIIIGDVGVGKSCIVLRLTENNVRETHEPTIGVEFGAKIMRVDDVNIKLQIWDTAGQENFRSIIRSYYRSAIGALLVYDITKRETFHNLQIWMDEIRNNGNPNMVIMLIGNKVDKIEREVTFEEGLEFSKTHKLMFMETCATNGTNVESSFYYATLQILRDIQDQKIFVGQDPGIKVGREYQQQKDFDNVQQNTPIKLGKKKSKQCC